MYLTLTLAALAATVLASGPGNAPIDPLSIEYSNSAEESNEAKICEMVAVLTNIGSPERVTISAFAGYDKVEAAIAVGFVVGAAKLSSDGDLEIIEVTSAAFTSDSFNSADELDHEVSGEGDGLFMAATAEGQVANRFLRSVAAGGFYLTLSGDDPEVSDWTYKVKNGPPTEVRERFARCLDELEPGTVSLREAHTLAWRRR
jgi:hypothetical protein